MVHGISHDVNHGIEQPLDHIRVEFDIPAGNIQDDALARCAAHFAHRLLKAREQRVHRDHPRLGDFIPQAEGQLLKPAHVLSALADHCTELRHGLGNVGRYFRHTAGEDVDIVIFVEFQLAEVHKEPGGRHLKLIGDWFGE